MSGKDGKLIFIVNIWRGGKNKVSSEGNKPPSVPQRGAFYSWLTPRERAEIRLAIVGLSDNDPKVRRTSAEILAEYASEEVLLALRAANAVESIVACKAEILHAICAVEERIQPQPQTA